MIPLLLALTTLGFVGLVIRLVRRRRGDLIQRALISALAAAGAVALADERAGRFFHERDGVLPENFRCPWFTWNYGH